MIKIESIIQRQGGTHVTLGTTNYHFLPDAACDNAHVADVSDLAHVSRFLSIVEGYKVFGRASAAPVMPEPAAAPVAPAGVSSLPDSFTIGGVTISLAEVTALAIASEEISTELWLDLTDDERTAKIETQLDLLQDAADMPVLPPLVIDVPDELSGVAASVMFDEKALAAERAQLVIEHQAMFDSKPHHKWTVDRIREALAAGPAKEA